MNNNTQPQLTPNSKPTLKAANDNVANLKAANDNRQIANGLAKRVGLRGLPFIGHILLLQDLQRWHQESQQRLKNYIEQQKEQDDQPSPEKQERAIFELFFWPETQTSDDDSDADKTKQQNRDAASKSQAEQEQEKDICFEPEDYGVDQQFSRERPIDDDLNPLVTTLANLGNTFEQEQRLRDIYEQRPHESPGVTLYRNHMYEVALQEGREVMDRGQAAYTALDTDRRAFAVIAQVIDDEEAQNALLLASPNITNLSPSEQNTYLQHAQLPDRMEVVVRWLERQQERGGNDLTELTWQPPQSISQEPATPRQQQLFKAEWIDLALHPIPGQKVDIEIEYLRQLGEHIRFYGRDNLGITQEECEEEKGKLSTDQRIAIQMFVAGYRPDSIANTIQQSSPAVAAQGMEAQVAYASREILPILEQESVQAYRAVANEWRATQQIPQDIRRFDCLQQIFQDYRSGEWEPERLTMICPDHDPRDTEHFSGSDSDIETDSEDDNQDRSLSPEIDFD